MVVKKACRGVVSENLLVNYGIARERLDALVSVQALYGSFDAFYLQDAFAGLTVARGVHSKVNLRLVRGDSVV